MTGFSYGKRWPADQRSDFMTDFYLTRFLKNKVDGERAQWMLKRAAAIYRAEHGKAETVEALRAIRTVLIDLVAELENEK